MGQDEGGESSGGDESAMTLGPKVKAWRSEKYRRYVASQPCAACGIFGYSQCAHANKGRGLGQKSPDSECFPLCSVRPGHMGCHQMHDLLLDITLDQRRRLETLYVERMQARAIQDGWRFEAPVECRSEAAECDPEISAG